MTIKSNNKLITENKHHRLEIYFTKLKTNIYLPDFIKIDILLLIIAKTLLMLFINFFISDCLFNLKYFSKILSIGIIKAEILKLFTKTNTFFKT
jgi:hypothetical protein